MAVSVNWSTKVIYVPKADLTPKGGVVYELDVNWLRLQLKNLEDSDAGMACQDTHRHNTEVQLSGVTYARFFEIINGYTVEFEDGQYVVMCTGANHNLADVKVQNQVSLVIGNAAGLITVSSGSGLSTEEHEWLQRILESSDIKRCTVQDASPTTSKFNTSLVETVNGFWDRAAILFNSGDNKGVIRGVKTYKVANGELTLETPLPYAPETGDEIVMIAARKFLAPDMDRVLGLSQENFRMKNQVYDGDGNLTSATVRIYQTAADAQNDVNPIAEYAMTASFAGAGLCTSYLMREMA